MPCAARTDVHVAEVGGLTRTRFGRDSSNDDGPDTPFLAPFVDYVRTVLGCAAFPPNPEILLAPSVRQVHGGRYTGVTGHTVVGTWRTVGTWVGRRWGFGR